MRICQDAKEQPPVWIITRATTRNDMLPLLPVVFFSSASEDKCPAFGIFIRPDMALAALSVSGASFPSKI
jgi:hypothetical protein